MNLKTEVTPPSIDWSKLITRSSIVMAVAFVAALILRIRTLIVVVDVTIIAVLIAAFITFVVAFVAKNVKS
jgi:hypothetical protein